MAIFGVNCEDNPTAADDNFSFARRLWKQATSPTDTSTPLLECKFTELMQSTALIRVYICTALAKLFFDTDILSPLVLEKNAKTTLATGREEDSVFWTSKQGIQRYYPRRFRLVDQNLHRVYLPLTCAVTLCNSIKPRRMAFKIASYVADIIPQYATTPLMLKYSQDLETYVIREGRVAPISQETWAEWTLQTLNLIFRLPDVLHENLQSESLVQSLANSLEIPIEMIQMTNILQSLQMVTLSDWGAHSQQIEERATALLSKFRTRCNVGI
ncbi:hypothetical protein BU17DRAFT_64123 [Hysterangium stoloniferum]|nr:hypothetical protein BU17DRAFT_64123 [Hysterangium stoloniferum]